MSETCAICLDSVNDPLMLTTKCKHTFHEYCLDTWLTQSKTCPFCRENCFKYECQPNKWLLYRERIITRCFDLDEANVVFKYHNNNQLSWKATWFITGASNTWLPRPWKAHIYQHGDIKTKFALGYLLNGTPSFIRSNNGDPPNRLRVCKFCNNVVYSEKLDLDNHIRAKHKKQNKNVFERLFLKNKK